MVKDIVAKNEKETRAGFGEGIYELGKKNENVVVLTADLAGSLKLHPFIKDFPEPMNNSSLIHFNPFTPVKLDR